MGVPASWGSIVNSIRVLALAALLGCSSQPQEPEVQICRLSAFLATDEMDEQLKCVNEPELIDGQSYIRNRCDHDVVVYLESAVESEDGTVGLGTYDVWLRPNGATHVAENECFLGAFAPKPIPGVIFFDGTRLHSEQERVLDTHANFLVRRSEWVAAVEGRCCSAGCDERMVDGAIQTVVERLLAGGVPAGQILTRNMPDAEPREDCPDAAIRIEVVHGYKRVAEDLPGETPQGAQ